MTDREKAIVMAYTGYCMLAGDKLKVFYEYVGELLGRPVYTHEFADPDIQEKASDDFYKLCRETTPEETITQKDWADYWHKLAQSYAHTICEMSKAIAEHGEKRWIPCSERLPMQTGEYLVTILYGDVRWTDKFGYTPTKDGGWYDPEIQNQNLINWNKCVIAWMPLPKAWKEGQEEGEPIPQWRGCMDGCLPYYDGKEVKE